MLLSSSSIHFLTFIMSGVIEVPSRRRPRKFRAASDGVDRISELPEDLIIHILSLLPTTEARIRTGVLSRRWKDLWTCVPKLYFCFDNDLDGVDQSSPYGFVKHVDKTLNRILSCGTKVEEFVVKWPFHDDFSSDVDECVELAARFQTDKFELVLGPSWLGSIYSAHFYVVPEHLYTNSYFKELRFNFCEVVPRGTVSWDSLKKLTIVYGRFEYEDLEKILAGAPALEFLELGPLHGISRLHFGNSALKKLVLHIHSWRYTEDGEAAFEISAPSLESLEVSGRFRTCKLVDMTSLVEATLFGDDTLFTNSGYPILTEEVVSTLSNVKTLTVGTWVIQGIATLPTNDGRPLFPNCECLTIDTHLWTVDPSAIAGLLKNTPGVKTLTVTIADSDSQTKFFRNKHSRRGNSNVDQYWTSQATASNYLTSLTTVKFIGFWAYRTVAFPFVQFVLKNARGLQKVVIDLQEKDILLEFPQTELLETFQKLLSYPKSSPDAKLLIYP